MFGVKSTSKQENKVPDLAIKYSVFFSRNNKNILLFLVIQNIRSETSINSEKDNNKIYVKR